MGPFRIGDSPLRILFLDADISYMNPTRNLWPDVLRGAAQTDFFGPGYSSRRVLDMGLESFVAQRGPYDWILASEHVLFSDATGWSVDNYTRNYGFSMPADDLRSLPSILEELLRITGVRRASTLLESDYYNFNSWQIERVDHLSDLVIGWGEQFVRPLADLPNVESEAFARKVSDGWARFTREKRDRILPLVHFVGPEEFCGRPLASRRYEIVVPGARYARREVLRESLPEPKDVRTLRMAGRVARGAARRVGSPRVSESVRRLTRWTYVRELFNTRSAFADGSRLNYPVRKYFEIPAAGALLLCEPCAGFEELGFVDQRNCTVEDFERLGSRGVPRLPRYEWQTVAAAGREMVARNHSVHKRSLQLRDTLIRASSDRFRGAAWSYGQLIELGSGEVLG